MVEFFFFFLEAVFLGEVHKLAKKNETNIFPIRTEEANSIKFLSLWLFYEFAEFAYPFISANAWATKIY